MLAQFDNVSELTVKDKDFEPNFANEGLETSWPKAEGEASRLRSRVRQDAMALDVESAFNSEMQE